MMLSARMLVVCAALCVGNASKEESVAQRLWQQAWTDALDQAGLSNANVDNMPPELKDSLQQKAIKIWKTALAQRQASESTTTVVEATTTQNAAMTALLSGIDGHQVVDLSYQASTTTTTTTEEATTTTTTTTSTEDQEALQQKKAELLSMQKAAMQRLTDGMGKDEPADATTTTTEATTTEATTTTENKAMMALLAGVEPGVPASRSAFLANPAPTTTTTTTTEATTTEATTTTEDPRAVEEREQQKQQLLEMHKNVMSKLTSGFSDIDKEEATATTTTVATTTTTTTTTKNLAMLRLLDGVDGPAQAKGKAEKKAATTTTTTTTTTQTIGAAGKKTLAFITSGTFNWQKVKAHNQPEAPADKEEDDEDQDKPEPSDGGEAAADFDMDNSA